MEILSPGIKVEELISKTDGYKVVKFRPENLGSLRLNAEAKGIMDFIGGDVMGRSMALNGPAFSAYHNDNLIVVAGINLLWKGVGEAWVMFGCDPHDHFMFIHRTTVRYLNRLSEDLGLVRVQAVVKENHWAGIEWVNRMGFQFEGQMDKYFNDETYLRYAKIRRK